VVHAPGDPNDSISSAFFIAANHSPHCDVIPPIFFPGPAWAFSGSWVRTPGRLCTLSDWLALDHQLS
jgi:hypothetical protein